MCPSGGRIDRCRPFECGTRSKVSCAERALAVRGRSSFLASEPLRVSYVPAHGFFQAGLETLPRPPVQLTPDLCSIDRVAAIVTRAVLHVGNQLGVAPLPARLRAVEEPAQRAHEID